MTGSVRNLFMSVETQSHVSHVIWQVAKTSFVLASKNGTLPQDIFEEVKIELSETEGKDITEVAKFFRKRCRFFKNNFEESIGTISYIMRFVVKNDAQLLQKTPGLTHKNVQTLYDRLRELDPLIQNLKYYRNFFSHNFNNIENFGWSGSVLSSVIRLCEIALIEKKDHEKNQSILLSFSQELSSLYHNNSSKLESGVVVKEPSEPSEHDFKYVIDEIKASKSMILERLDAMFIPSNIQAQQSTETISISKRDRIAQVYSSENEIVDDTEEDNADSEFSEESNISPEILRQELSRISDEIKEEYGSQPGFGANANLLQIANIGAILEHEPQTFKDFLELEIVNSRIDFELPIIKVQIEKYENQIDKLFASVLWLSAFEV